MGTKKRLLKMADSKGRQESKVHCKVTRARAHLLRALSFELLRGLRAARLWRALRALSDACDAITAVICRGFAYSILFARLHDAPTIAKYRSLILEA